MLQETKKLPAIRLVANVANDGSTLRETSSDIERLGNSRNESFESRLHHRGRFVASLARQNGAEKAFHLRNGGVVELGGDSGSPCGLLRLKI